VANLASVTQGWSSLTTAVTVGSSSNTGHANDRSPLWGRLDEIEVWQGQMAASDVQGLPGAAQSVPYRIPSGNLYNVADYGSIQAAMDAAHNDGGGGWVYQEASNTTWYEIGKDGEPNNTALYFKPNCRGMVGVRLKKPDGEAPGSASPRWARIINVTDNMAGGQMDASDRYAGSGGYQFIGCRIDGNARGQSYHPRANANANTGPVPDGYTYHGMDLQQSHALFIGNSSVITITVDCCEFYDGTGDAISMNDGTRLTAKSNRFYGYFRGSHVINQANVVLDALRFESFERSELGSVANGCGLMDIEPFGSGAKITATFSDGWVESDFDDTNEGTGSTSTYRNCHIPKAGLIISAEGWTSGVAPAGFEMRYCTMGFHKHFGNFPPCWWIGFRTSLGSAGAVFDNCVFLANGEEYCHHEWQWLTPSSSDVFEIIYKSSPPEGRLWTMRNCELRAKSLPSGIPTGNVRFISLPGMSTSQSVEFDGFVIDAAFADAPITLGGITVRYRDVVHERTGSSKPWSGAGAEVAL
jgi:hypothetical protein